MMALACRHCGAFAAAASSSGLLPRSAAGLGTFDRAANWATACGNSAVRVLRLVVSIPSSVVFASRAASRYAVRVVRRAATASSPPVIGDGPAALMPLSVPSMTGPASPRYADRAVIESRGFAASSFGWVALVFRVGNRAVQ